MAISLSGQRCEEIKRIVIDLYEKYDISCTPISGFELAIKMGVEVVPYSSYTPFQQERFLEASEDGFTARRGNVIKILYNQSKKYKRINNTLLHEIGHIVLEHTQDSELAEAEAKFFAKYALAPPVLIHKLKEKTPENISDVFDISYEAATYALEYYQKWLAYGSNEYTDYELRTLKLFKDAVWYIII